MQWYGLGLIGMFVNICSYINAVRCKVAIGIVNMIKAIGFRYL